jgi:diguanylate cyclase (GGDEF)-like protein
VLEAGAPPRILAVDDDPTVRSFVRALLSDAGYDVLEAASGADALTICQAECPDLILLDVAMPGMDGISTCAALRGIPHAAAVPIVMLTGSDDLEAIDRAYQAGATDFTTKSVHWLVLVERVRYLLRAKQAVDHLRRSEFRLAAAERIGRLGYWEWDLSTGGHVWSDETRRMLGAAIGSDPTQALFLACIHPDDRSDVQAALATAAETGEPCALQCRLTSVADTPLVVQVQAESTTEPGGQRRTLTGTVQDVTERLQAEARIRRLAHYDELTGLPNRTLFRDQVQQAIATARRAGRHLAVLLMDLDDFKRINDSLGHGVGDTLLIEVARRIARAVRESDIVARTPERSHDAVLARHGGDEFAICLGEMERAEDAVRVGTRLLEALAPPVPVGSGHVQMTASIGISLFPHDGLDAETLLQHADAAMYHAKASGRNGCRLYNEGLGAEVKRRLTFEADLRRALEGDELQLCFQPIVEVTNGRLVAAEALVRWMHPTRGLLSPGEFIPLAEQVGLIVPLGDWVLEHAARARARWAVAGHIVRVAVNLSAQQFRRAELVERLEAVLQLAGPGPAPICLEITENALLEQGGETLAILRAIRDLDIRIALDDFGTGYSSLSYLQRLPVDVLKLDRSFVGGVTTSARDSAITAAIARMSLALGIEPLAEGVECAEQRDLLSAQGYGLMQGYLFGRPWSEPDLLAALGGEVGPGEAPSATAESRTSK